MRSKLKLVDQKGFSLIEILMALGIIGVLTVAFADLIVSSQKAKRDLSAAMDLISLQDDIRRTIASTQICNSRLASEQKKLKTGDLHLKLRLSTGQTLDEKTEIQGYALKDVTLKISNMNDIPVATGGSIKMLDLSLEAKGPTGFPFKLREIGSLAVFVDASGNIVSCGAPEVVATCPAGYVSVSNGAQNAPTCRPYVASTTSSTPSSSTASSPIPASSTPSPSAISSSTPASSTPSPSAISSSTPKSSCAYSASICKLYGQIGRNPDKIDAGGAAFWQSQLNAGKSEAEVLAEMQATVKAADRAAASLGLPNSQALLNGDSASQSIYYNQVAPKVDEYR